MTGYPDFGPPQAQPLDGRTWLSSSGTRYALICGAYTKYAIEHSRPSPAEQLQLVEDLMALRSGDVTSAAMKELRPFDHATARLVETAMDLPPAASWRAKETSAGFDVLTGPSWAELCWLNPSLDRALKLCVGYWLQEAA
jgi:hypothetical protein